MSRIQEAVDLLLQSGAKYYLVLVKDGNTTFSHNTEDKEELKMLYDLSGEGVQQAFMSAMGISEERIQANILKLEEEGITSLEVFKKNNPESYDRINPNQLAIFDTLNNVEEFKYALATLITIQENQDNGNQWTRR